MVDYEVLSKYFQYGKGDVAFLDTVFYTRRSPVDLLDELMCVNERLVGLLTVICNVVVVLVFIRVLGLTRLASRLIVSVAFANIAIGVTNIVHSLAVTSSWLSNTSLKCRLLFQIDTTIHTLKWACLASAVLERILAINLPSQYMAYMAILAPTLIVAPWAYWVYRTIVGFVLHQVIFQTDMGSTCQHHVMGTILDDPMGLVPQLTAISTVILMLLLIITRTLHPPHYDNIWEANRLKLEYKTTDIIFQLLAPTFLLWLPTAVACCIVVHGSTNIYNLLVIKHICYQITIYNNPVLFLVMLKRKEFRKAFWLIFASKETIRQSRLPNYLLVSAEMSWRTKSYSVTESVTVEPRAPLAVAAREDYRSLIDETDMLNTPVKKKQRGQLMLVEKRDSLE
ncbi:hypothetical protein BsWGS_07215 [Bradybaena similaris]